MSSKQIKISILHFFIFNKNAQYTNFNLFYKDRIIGETEINNMELLDIVDEKNNITGKIVDREIVHKDGLWHREVGVIIINEKGELLLEKRSATKKQSPNKWAICAGHIESGDIPENAIVREIKEEIGIDVKFEDLQFLDVFKRNKKFENGQENNTFIYIYVYKTKNKIEDYTIQIEELSEVKYFPKDKIENALKENNLDYAFYDEHYIKDILNRIKEM